MTKERRRELKELVMSLLEVGVPVDDCYGLEECIDKAFEADRYRWHDLRKDPYDLPKEDGEYLIAYLWMNSEKVHHNLENYVQGSFCCPPEAAVIAWGCIKLFEEDEE